MEAAVKRDRSAGDRLSALTDDLLHRVLSFLPAPEVVRTSALSKRWRDLWRSVPDINLNIWNFPTDSDGEVCSRWRKMEDFTTNLLMRHRAPRLNAFRLFIFSIRADWFRDVSRWIRRAVEYQPSVLQIELVGGCGYQYLLPHLGCSRLTRLHLSLVSLDHSFAQQLLSGLPVLEDLVLNQCHLEFDQSNTVKNLVMACCWIQDADMFVVRTPCLASICLKFCNYSNTPVSLEAGNFLATVSISILPGHFSQRYEAMLIGSLFNVMSLTLEGFNAMAMLDKELDQFPMFENLRTLSICSYFNENDVHKLKALGRFLQKSPNLEKLTLQHFWDSETSRTVKCSSNLGGVEMVRSVVGLIDFPVLENFRTLFLDQCDLCDNFHLLRHCLWNSPNLEKLSIHRCKLPEASTVSKRKTKSKKKSCSQFQNVPPFKCQKLKSTEIIFEDGDDVGELVRFLVDTLGCAPNNIMSLTKFAEK